MFYNQILTISVLLCFVQVFRCKKSSDDDSIFSTHGSFNLPLQHSFGPDDEFSNRGVVVFKSSKITTAAFAQETELTEGDLDKLRELVKKDGLYFIRSPTTIGGSFEKNENNETNYVLTFVKACYLYGSGMQESITVAIDYSGNVIGLNIVSPRSDCAVKKKVSDKAGVFNSTVLVQQQVPGAVPDTQTFVKKIEQEKADEAAGKGKDNRSFIAKYWMYILPVFLILMLSSQAEQPAEGGGGDS